MIQLARILPMKASSYTSSVRPSHLGQVVLEDFVGIKMITLVVKVFALVVKVITLVVKVIAVVN